MGNKIIHLSALEPSGLIGKIPANLLNQPILNPLIEAGPEVWRTLRNRIQELFSDGNQALWGSINPESCLVEMNSATLHLPIHIGDYTDFYSSEYHATNVGVMLRDPKNALMPNWKHLPVGYHGRSSSIVVSGTNFHRPKGQMKPANLDSPIFGPSKQLDIELETAFVMGKNTKMGSQVGVDEAEDFMFGMMLFNDWSARDLQTWEYAPLGPFLGKNFCSTVSPWIVTFDALKPFQEPMPHIQEPAVLPYLAQNNPWTYDIKLEVEFLLKEGQSKIISVSNQKFLYWTMNQQLAHHTVNGCPMRVGDLLASGTISGPTQDSLGCLLEITKRGQNPVSFDNGLQRSFMEDGDSVIIRGHCSKGDIRVGFGEVRGTVLPAL